MNDAWRKLDEEEKKWLENRRKQNPKPYILPWMEEKRVRGLNYALK